MSPEKVRLCLCIIKDLGPRGSEGKVLKIIIFSEKDGQGKKKEGGFNDVASNKYVEGGGE